ncbi:MAG: sigma-54-dependent Fis family transcriptional regulator [Gemmatimonadetes bacterium]|nr:sigma-54-dependent Fis family transcriptional regulator [Gemmatimonadota bacterium]
MLVRTLLALHDDALAGRIEGILDTRDVSIFRASEPDEVWRLLQREDIDLLVASDIMARPTPEDWVAAVRTLPEAPDLVLLADREDPSRRAALLGAGCLAVLNARLTDRELRGTFNTLILRLAHDAAARLQAQRLGVAHGFEDVVHRSRAMDEVVTMARRVAAAETSLLILGETGVGKERVARSIHFESSRAAGPFVPVNCGAIPEGLLESELFGHEQGAFTGAVRARRGHFEVAHRGTLFLDEIGELPLHLQVKLLRVLEDRQVQRVGSERPERVDVRIIAATNRDLEAEVAARRFRPDLYYRLAVVTLAIPPLRDRREDIPDLVDRFLAHFRRTLGKPVEGIEPEAREALQRHRWPGNVRELINVLERALLLAQGPRVTVGDLPRSIAGAAAREAYAERPPGTFASSPPLLELPIREARRRAVTEFERGYLVRLLAETGGRVGETARRAGVSERSLYDLMRRAGLDKADFRGPTDGNRRKIL